MKDFPPPPPLPGASANTPVLKQVTAVVGMPVEEAEMALGRDGFRAERELGPSDDYPPGYVVGASPDSGLLAPAASPVLLKVSTGPATATVPDVLDRTAAEAQQRIGDAGLKVRLVVQAEPKSIGSDTRPGKVWKQAPQTGTRTDLGATVAVYVNPAPVPAVGVVGPVTG
jgi:serine/threonine-protein kinase